MANTTSAKKAIRVTQTRTAQNRKLKAQIARLTKKTLKLISLGESKLAQQQFQATSKALDKAAKNKVIHPNSASRKKSNLAKKLNSLKKDVKTAPKNS